MPLRNLKQRRIQIACIQRKVLKHIVLKPSSPADDRRYKIKFFKTSSPRAGVGEKRFKVLLALSEHRQEQITRPLCISKLRQVESPQCIRGGDVTPGQVEAPEKVLLTLE